MANVDISGRLHSIATGNIVAGANEILDDDLSKKQSQINAETYGYVQSINDALEGLSPEQQEALSVSNKANNNEAKLGYYVCTTEGNIAAKTIAAPNYILSLGGNIKIKMVHANSASGATLNINSTGPKTLLYNGEPVSSNNTWEDNDVISVYYDGTHYMASNSLQDTEGVKEYAIGGIPVLQVGKAYSRGDVVRDSVHKVVRVKQIIRTLDLSDAYSTSDIVCYNNKTYIIKKNVLDYSDLVTYVDGSYARKNGVICKYNNNTWTTATLGEMSADTTLMQEINQNTLETYTSSYSQNVKEEIDEYLVCNDRFRSTLRVINFYINATNNKWVKSPSGDKAGCNFIEVKKGQIIAIKSTNINGYAITFLNNTDHIANTNASFANGFTGVVTGFPEQVDFYYVNQDCYLYYLEYANKYGAYYPRTPEYVALVKNRLDVLEEKIYNATGEEGTTVDLTYKNAVYNVTTKKLADTQLRVCTNMIPISYGDVLVFELAGGFRYNVVYMDRQGNIQSALGNSWNSEKKFRVGNHDGYIGINISNWYDTDIDAETFNALTATKYKDLSLAGAVAEAESNFFKIHDNKYIGERIDIKSKSYSINNIRVLEAADNYSGVQSLAVFDNLMFIGRAREEDNKTSYLLYNLDGFVKKILLPHTGYGAIHANTTCFGEASQYSVPLMYCSQWDEQRACFVYELDDDFNPSLIRVIDPANLDTSRFGAGPSDWIVGDGFLYSITYKLASPYYSEDNGLIVSKFALPTGNGVIYLSDADIIESFSIEPNFIRQDSCFINGKIYTLFGSTGQYEEFKKMFVIDVRKKKVVSICDLAWTAGEPECISEWNGELVMMFNSITQGVFKFNFD